MLSPFLSSLTLVVLFLFSCKVKDAEPQLTSQKISDRKFDWCKPSESALSTMLDAISSFEATGQTSFTRSTDGRKFEASKTPDSVYAILATPPKSVAPPCGADFDQAMSQTGAAIASIIKGEATAVALNVIGGSCEIQNSTGILSVTKIKGGYSIEMMSCGGRTHTQMVLPADDAMKLMKVILRGV